MKNLHFSNNDAMPVLGLGTWKSEPGEVYEAVKTAIKLGYRHIDCAPVYGNEVEVGKALAESFDEGIVSREEMWITSKLWNDNHAPEHVGPAISKTLQDLRLDYLDLFLIHWPINLKHGIGFPQKADDFVSLEELPLIDTWSAMEELVDKGLCRHIGVSNFSIAKTMQLLKKGHLAPEVNQVEMHPYLQQQDLIDFCNANNILLTAYSPLGSPDRPAQLKAADEPVLLEDPVIRKIADQINATPGQVLIAWAIIRGTSVIPKSVNPARIKQNLEAASINLSWYDWEAINKLDIPRRYVTGSFWEFEGGPYTVGSIWDE